MVKRANLLADGICSGGPKPYTRLGLFLPLKGRIHPVKLACGEAFGHPIFGLAHLMQCMHRFVCQCLCSNVAGRGVFLTVPLNIS